MQTIVTKAEYAKLKNRSPSCISNWIKEGKITPAALIGTGVRSRIWVEQADADLLRNLDVGQQTAQATPIMPSGPAPDLLHPAPRPAYTDDEENVRRKRKADADRAEEEAEAARRRNLVDAGRWIDAAEAKRVWTGEFARELAETETFLFGSLAEELAEDYGLDWKAVSVNMRKRFRAYRSRAADSAVSRYAEREAELKAAE